MSPSCLNKISERFLTNRRNCAAISFLCSMLLVTFLLHCLTLTRSPTLGPDEVQVIDYGRMIDAPTPWSLTLAVDGESRRPGSPIFAFLVWKWVTCIGPGAFFARLFSCFAAVGAVLVFCQLLRVMGVGVWMSVVLALSLWFDPLFVTSFRQMRPDSFALFLCFLACWAWQHALVQNSRAAAFFAGVAAITAYFSWPTSAVFLLLGIFLFLLKVVKREPGLCTNLCWGMVGAFTAFVIISVVFDYTLIRFFHRFSASESAIYPDGHPLHGSILSTIVEHYARSPWVLLWALAAVVASCWNRRGLGILLVISAGLALAWTRPPFYAWRLLYVVPLFYVLMGMSLTSPRIPKLLFVLLVVPSLFVNLGVRSAIAVKEWQQRDFTKVEERLTTLIPDGSVVVGRWAHYYTGLRHDWKMYSHFHFGAVADRYDEFYLVHSTHESIPNWTGGMTYKRLIHVNTYGTNEEERKSRSGRGYSFDVYLFQPNSNHFTTNQEADHHERFSRPVLTNDQ